MMGTIHEVELIALAQAPQWVRQDISAAEPAKRARAEAMIASMVDSILDESTADPTNRLRAIAFQRAGTVS